MELIKLWDADEDAAYELFKTFREDENGFENIAYGKSRAEFTNLVEAKRKAEQGMDLPEGFVPDTVYLLMDDEGNYVGIFNLRHRLNAFLASGPGHIGYGISPGYRKKGYATRGLALVIKEASKIVPEDELYLSADRTNTGSIKAQLANGARIVRETEEKYYTRIPKVKED